MSGTKPNGEPVGAVGLDNLFSIIVVGVRKPIKVNDATERGEDGRISHGA